MRHAIKRIMFVLLLAALPASAANRGEPAMVLPGERATRIHVDKSERRLTLYRDDRVLAQYRIRLGAHPAGHKTREGDEKTPEGAYVIDYKNPESEFHLALHVSYPNAQDRQRAAQAGVSPGGAIMVHGGNAFWRPFNWTDGCIAVTNEEIRAIWSRVDAGTPIQIDP